MTTTILGDILHPEYSFMGQRWREWRLTYESGQYYIENFLVWFKYESKRSYNERKDLTYVPAFAKEAINEVRNSLWSRLGDVERMGGPLSYIQACNGDEGGVDQKRSTMSDWIGRHILRELLTMRRVGVWIDMPKVWNQETKATASKKHPYLCWYPVESIRSWATDDKGRLTRILLKQSNFMHDEATGLPMSGDVDSFRYAWLGDPDKGEDPRVHVREEDADGKQVVDEFILDMEDIPFVQFQIDHSLLEDVCKHQKALLNMESSDVHWCVKANFPIWTQQFDPRSSPSASRPAQQRDKPSFPRPGFDGPPPINTPVIPAVPAGQAKEASESKALEVTVGPQTGISYPKDLERPGWVHPSAEPLTAAMAKEMQIKEDIRRLVHLSVAALDPRMASAESKEMDDRGLHVGLCAIGAALERGEREIAHHWAAYSREQAAEVQYPADWSMENDSTRRQDAKALLDQVDRISSKTFRKEIMKLAAKKMLSHKVSQDVMDAILAEVDLFEYPSSNVDDLSKDLQNSLVSAEYASEVVRGYPAGQVQKALEERAHQLAIMALSQTPGGGIGAVNGAKARGIPSGPADDSSKVEKKLAASSNGIPEDQTRGFGQDGGSDPLGTKPVQQVVDQN